MTLVLFTSTNKQYITVSNISKPILSLRSEGWNNILTAFIQTTSYGGEFIVSVSGILLS